MLFEPNTSSVTYRSFDNSRGYEMDHWWADAQVMEPDVCDNPSSIDLIPTLFFFSVFSSSRLKILGSKQSSLCCHIVIPKMCSSLEE